jgi:hypothetical protein
MTSYVVICIVSVATAVPFLHFSHTNFRTFFFFAVALNFPYFSPQNALGVEFVHFMLDVAVALLSTQSPMIFTEHFSLNNFSHEYSDVK